MHVDSLINIFDWRTLVATSIVTSFVVHVIDTYTPPKFSPKYILPIVSLIVVLTKVSLKIDTDIESIQSFVFSLLLNMSGAIIFYIYIGEWFINKLIEIIKSAIANKLPKETNDTHECKHEETTEIVKPIENEETKPIQKDDVIDGKDDKNI